MKIGVSATTFSRPLHIQHWIKTISETARDEVIVHIADDSKERKGIAFRKNECLKKLYDEGCDFFFLFDDDTFTIKEGWIELFIKSSIQTGMHHYQLMKESSATKITHVLTDPDVKDFIPVNVFNNTNGCMMFFTRECIEKVGGFNPAYFYGMEHCELSNRIHQAGLTKYGAYACPEGADKFLYALDLEPWSDLHKKLKHKSSLSNTEAVKYANESLKVYSQPSKNYIPL
jgi:hypothetical protein